MTRLRANPWAVLVVLSLGFFMILLDTTIVNIAVPSILSDLNTSLDQILWVLNAYILVYAVLLITAGRLGDLWSPKYMFVAGLAVFTLASMACGAAQNADQLIAFRVVQGVGGAMLTPQTLTIITSIFEPTKRGAAFGVPGGVAGIAALTGPTLGGALVTWVNWRWIFYVNVPIGIFTIVAAALIIPNLRPGRRHGFDIVGVLLATAGLFLITFGLIEGQKYDWGTVTGIISIPLLLAGGVVLVIAFFAWERFQAEPLIPLSLFADRNYSLMNFTTAAVAFGMLGMFLPVTIFLQSVLGFSAIKAGLTFLPMSLVSMPVAPFAGRLADRIGGKYILLFGLTMFSIGFGLIDLVASVNADWYTFTLPAMVAGVGLGCTFAPMVTVAMRNIEPRMAGAASGVFNTTRQLGGVLGSAVVGAVLQNRLATALHDQAVARSAGLPAQFRQRFIDGFSQASKSGFQVGRGQSGGANLPSGLPPQVAHQLQQISHDVFAYGFIDAMRPTLLVGVLVLGLAALSCLGIKRRRREPQPATAQVAVA
ncbi:MAG: DHA2 family efflux MFS transporter permease subunit [Chloroflexi bacterium]|nr:MAG: DHA2 family efflux MFS transporter permease subunit [Chloroflexota bacterium]